MAAVPIQISVSLVCLCLSHNTLTCSGLLLHGSGPSFLFPGNFILSWSVCLKLSAESLPVVLLRKLLFSFRNFRKPPSANFILCGVVSGFAGGQRAGSLRSESNLSFGPLPCTCPLCMPALLALWRSDVLGILKFCSFCYKE